VIFLGKLLEELGLVLLEELDAEVVVLKLKGDVVPSQLVELIEEGVEVRRHLEVVGHVVLRLGQ